MEINLIPILVSLCTVIGITEALECYTCVNQDNNQDKCIKTVKQCEKHYDICRTDIKWGIPPYWTPHGDRIYKISKDCDTERNCERDRYELRNRCKRDWYDDWDCVECCSGDMCNYYVTLGAANQHINIILLIASLVTVLLLRHQGVH